MTGLNCARFVAWHLQRQGGWNNWLREAVVAAMLQDVGQSEPKTDSAASDAMLNRTLTLKQQHPLRSAILLQGIAGSPITIPEMVAQHHERVNGKGFPRALSADRQSELGRGIAVTTRLWELVEQGAGQTQTRSAIWTAASGRLLQESKLGWWCKGWCERIVRSLRDAGLVDRAAQDQESTRDVEVR